MCFRLLLITYLLSGLPLGLPLGRRSPDHGHIIPKRWACVIGVKKKQKKNINTILGLLTNQDETNLVSIYINPRYISTLYGTILAINMVGYRRNSIVICIVVLPFYSVLWTMDSGFFFFFSFLVTVVRYFITCHTLS